MTEWWTYRLSDFLMFSPRTYWRLVEGYNREWWPLHVAMALAGIGVLVLAHRKQGLGAVAALQGAACLWVAWAFLWDRYADIYLGASWLAAAFGLQGVLWWVTAASVKPREQIGRAGAVLLWAGIVLYPLATAAFGAERVQMFGMFPDPTGLASLGAALSFRRWWLAIIPLGACISGVSTLAAIS